MTTRKSIEEPAEPALNYLEFRAMRSGSQVFVADVMDPLVIEAIQTGGTRMTYNLGTDELLRVTVADTPADVRQVYLDLALKQQP